MANKVKLTSKITEAEFDNGYWYADEIKAFAKQIGIPNSSKLRKDELEKIIKTFIKTGQISSSPRKKISQAGVKDYELGLDLSLKVNNYTSNKITKLFIHKEALKIKPELKKKSGTSYRLNRWREKQINKGNNITYLDLIHEYIRLNEQKSPFRKIPHGRYINFVAEYLSKEPNANRADAIKAWKELKTLDTPKKYSAWKKLSERLGGKSLK